MFGLCCSYMWYFYTTSIWIKATIILHCNPDIQTKQVARSQVEMLIVSSWFCLKVEKTTRCWERKVSLSLPLSLFFFFFVSLSTLLSISLRVCVCVWEIEGERERVIVFVCVSEPVIEREREKERERGESERETMFVCVCKPVFLSLCCRNHWVPWWKSRAQS